jgi:hypothetical protein
MHIRMHTRIRVYPFRPCILAYLSVFLTLSLSVPALNIHISIYISVRTYMIMYARIDFSHIATTAASTIAIAHCAMSDIFSTRAIAITLFHFHFFSFTCTRKRTQTHTNAHKRTHNSYTAYRPRRNPILFYVAYAILNYPQSTVICD